MRWRGAAVTIAVIATIGIWRTATVFSATVDEPAHIAAGVELLTGHRYAYDVQHPPLARIAAAIGPISDGARFTGARGVYEEGAAILGAGERHVRRLAAARHGEIVFFLLLIGAVWAWARTLAGELGAAIAVLLVATNPNILAHAGLATTDLACAATTTLALYCGIRWLERDDWPATIWFGVATGLAVASRLSAIGFVLAPLAALWAFRGYATKRLHISVARLGAAAALALGIIVAAYGFHVGAFVAGLNTFLLHGSAGHPTYLLGTAGNRGWWYYYPVALLVKTPLPLLALGVVGAVAAVRDSHAERNWPLAAPLIAGCVIIAISMVVHVDLGVRLVLPVYPLIAIVGAYGARQLLVTPVGRGVTLALLALAAVIPIRVYPDNLSYFNLLAGAHPERVLVDSNLDWGQDLYRLRDTLRVRGVRDSVRVAYFGTSDLGAIVPGARVLGLHERASGWIAASETFLAGEWVGGAYMWLLRYPPAARIGPGMRLWYIPAADDSTRATSPR